MAITIAQAGSRADSSPSELKRTARLTGLFYLGLAITGLVGMLFVRNRLFIADDPGATLANLVANPSLARVGIMMELGAALTQALAAVWFYRLFRGVDPFAAGCLAAFGLINTVIIMGSAAMLGTALDVAGDASLAASGDTAATAQLFYVVSGHFWGVGSLFFGMWLIPMGWLVLRSEWLPRPIGWILLGGGVGYILKTFVAYSIPGAAGAAELLTMPATIGELWIVGYLLILGVRDPS